MNSKTANEGMAIALQRIAAEAEAKTGFLDLGMLGLDTLPDELFELRHLRGLNLGLGCHGEQGEWREAASHIEENALQQSLAGLSALPELRSLSLGGAKLDDLSPLAGLTGLQT